MADASNRISEHRQRQERLEDAAADARSILAQRRIDPDDVDTIAVHAQDVNAFLEGSDLTERRAFIEIVVKDILVTPSGAQVRYNFPVHDDDLTLRRHTDEIPLDGSALPARQ